MEQRARDITRRQMLVIDREPPPQVRLATEQLLVEPVPPPPDRLRHRNRRSRRPQRRRHPNTTTPRRPHPKHHTERDPTGNAETALPDRRNRPEIISEAIPLGRHVIEPRADQTANRTPQTNRRGVISRPRTTRLETRTENPDRHQNPDRDHQTVETEIDRTERNAVRRRGRERGEHHRAATNATDRSAINSRSKS